MANKGTIIAGAVLATGIIVLMFLPPITPEFPAESVAIVPKDGPPKGYKCVPCDPSYFKVCRDGAHLIGSIPAPLGNYKVEIADDMAGDVRDANQQCGIRKVINITKLPSDAGASNSIELHEWDNVDFDYFCGFDLKVIKPWDGEPDRILCDLRQGTPQ